ncbi:putative leucine-rich repeat-containing protein DDB_G0290503 [Chironomus tepperi]|uniref:putative leucine-rich repeat-containing protein DDB_G0290503 n=1 Tax=Chironomus tepperi TaxID=113505 RepID=UPI00391EECF8
MKSSSKLTVLIQFLFITSISTRSNNYFGYVKVDSERSSTKLYSTSSMEDRFKSIVGKFANKRSEQISKNEILRTVQLRKAESELNKFDRETKDAFTNIERAFYEFEKLRSDDEIFKIKINLEGKEQNILEYENNALNKMLNDVLNNTTVNKTENTIKSEVNSTAKIEDPNAKLSSNNNTAENLIKLPFNSTAKIEELNAKLMSYSVLLNSSNILNEKPSTLDNATEMKVKLGDALVSNILEYHKLLDTFTLVDDLKNVLNETIVKRENLVESLKNINNDLFNEMSVFSTLKFKEIEPRRSELLHDINNPNFNDERLAETLIDKMIRNIKEELMSNVKWITIYEKIVLLPDNAVEGGADDEDNKYYVIRKQLHNTYYYGKYIRSDTRNNAYITTENAEIGTESFEILTSPRHVWCSYDKNKHENYMNIPVCRAKYFKSLIPGTLEANGSCRFGFGREIERITADEEFEVLQIYEC